MDCSCLSNENLDWSSAYLLALRCTKSTKLIEFHFKFLHRHLATNNFLFKTKLKENENCTFCHNVPQTLNKYNFSGHVKKLLSFGKA